ncbi:MAG: S-layer homology domain-containing protein, partial [Clostridia bacterium]|nr:S-layer homology domain-containing protein [Clostridia bacterium]
VDISGDSNEAYIQKAYGLNIVVGISDTEFAPDAGITREQLATMLTRTIKKYKFADWTFETDDEYYLDSEGVKKFADDADISDYAKPSVYYMVKMGIINGVSETHFAPKNTTSEQEASGYASATREQAIALALRTYKLSDMWK